MRFRLVLLSITAAACVATGLPAGAQQGARPLAPDQAQEGPRRAPPARQVSRSERLEALFGALKAAPNARAAQAVEARIDAMMMQSGSDTADLLIVRARGTMEAKNYD